METMVALAEEIAREAGAILLDRMNSAFKVEKKGRVNLVTEVDLAAETLIVNRLKSAYPDHQILTEEEGFHDGNSPFRWIVDPLDGTTNYAHGYPLFCVSIGLEVESEIVAGAVYDPVADECFTARKGSGAFLNNKPISVSVEGVLEDSLVCTGFSYSAEEISDNLELFNRVMMMARSVRRDGSAALDLCYVAAGRYDGFWEVSLNPWDVAAGMIIVMEAGGTVTKLDGSKASAYDRNCLATNGLIHRQLSEILASNLG